MAPTSTWFAGLAALSTLAQTTIAFSLFSESEPRAIEYTFERRQLPLSDRTRDARLRRRQSVSAGLDNFEIAYLLNLSIGTPPQQFSVQIDTGSSDLWVVASSAPVCLENPQGCDEVGAYNAGQSSTSQKAGGALAGSDEFSISYQDGTQVEGAYYNDTVTIGSATIKNQTFAAASNTQRILGIMGVGYSADESIAETNTNGVYPNVPANLANSNAIGSTAYSLWLNDQDSNTGTILFGGVNTAKYSGSLIGLPVQKSVNGTYTDFTVALSSFSFTDAFGKMPYNQQNIDLPVILDSGTSLTYLPDNILNPVLEGVGAINDPELGPIVPCKLEGSPSKFTFSFGGSGGPSIEVGFDEFVNPIILSDGSTPQFRNGGGSVCTFGIQSSGSSEDTQANPILLGDTFLRSAYVVYDLANNQIAMAQTVFNTTETNIKDIASSGIPGVSTTATAAAATQEFTGHPLNTYAYTRTAGSFSETSVVPSFALFTNKGAAAPLGPPRIEVTLVVSGLVVLGSLIVGSGLLMVRF